jgi:hypothetical protein
VLSHNRHRTGIVGVATLVPDFIWIFKHPSPSLYPTIAALVTATCLLKQSDEQVNRQMPISCDKQQGVARHAFEIVNVDYVLRFANVLFASIVGPPNRSHYAVLG